MHTLDLDTYQTSDSQQVGDTPDVIAYGPGDSRLYVAAESGAVTVFTEQDRHLTVLGRHHLADGAHVVAVDPATHRSYYPIARGPDGHPIPLVRAPTGE